MKKCRLNLLAALALVLGIGVSCEKAPDPVPVQTPTNSLVTNAAAASAVPRVEFQKLKGKWERPDGGYILEITEVQADGQLQAGYFNPNPIHVEKAVVIQETSGTKVFVVLKDTGYPGCTYKLSYDPATDQLHGQYFQAAMNETFDVTFGRVK